MAQLKRCEDASKNDQGWLVSDWRWISGIFEVGLTDIHTDIRTDRPSYRDARTHLKIVVSSFYTVVFFVISILLFLSLRFFLTSYNINET